MTTITTRSGKGSPLTNNEVDANFTNLNTDKAELSGANFTGSIDVSGTVTADGLTVDGSAAFNLGSGEEVSIYRSTDFAVLRLGASSTDHWSFQEAGTNSLYIGSTDSGTAVSHLKLDNNGDISFYEDTGTTAKFFWDASAESLGIGTSSTSGKLSISGATATNEQVHATFTNTQGAKTFAIGAGQSGVTNNGFVIRNVTDNTFPLVISDAGAATFSAGVTATGLEVEAATPVIEIDSTTSANLATLQFTTAGTVDSKITHQASSGDMVIESGRNSTWGGKIYLKTDTFQNAVFTRTVSTFNENSADIDFRVESDADVNAIFLDAGTGHLAIGSGSTSSSVNINDQQNFGRNYGADNSATLLVGKRHTANNTNAFGVAGTTHNTYYPSTFVIDSAYTANLTTYDLTAYGVAYSGWSGAMKFKISNGATAVYNMLGISVGGGVVINEESTSLDFRVESDSYANMLTVDAGTNRVGIRTSPAYLLHVDAAGAEEDIPLRVDGYKTGIQEIWLNNERAPYLTNGRGTQLVFGNNGTKGAFIQAAGYGSGGNGELSMGIQRTGGAGTLQTVLLANSNTDVTFVRAVGSSTAPLVFQDSGASNLMTLTASAVVVNEDSADQDFRVESTTNSNMLLVDASGGTVQVGHGNTGYAELDVQGDISIRGPSSFGTLEFRRGSAELVFARVGFDDPSQSNDTFVIDSSGNGNPMGFVTNNDPFYFWRSGDTSNTADVRITYAGGMVINENGSDEADFRVESDNNTHMLFVDAGNDHVNIGTSSDFGGVLNVNGGAVFDDATTFDPDTLGTGRIAIGNVNDGGGFIAPGICWGGGGGQNAAIVSTAGILYLGVGNRSTVDNLESVIELRNTEVTVNQLSADQDFRVESDSNAHGFFLDASTTSVGVNHTSSPGGYAQFAVRFSGSDSNVNTTGVAIQDSGTNSNISFCTFFNSTGGGIGSITRVGTTNAVAYNTTSDRRAKENIADADDAGAVIDAIQVRKFDWIEGNQHQPYGMIAQELVEHAPEVVHQPADEEDMMGVDYSKLVPMLVKEIQSLRARVAQLESN